MNNLKLWHRNNNNNSSNNESLEFSFLERIKRAAGAHKKSPSSSFVQNQKHDEIQSEHVPPDDVLDAMYEKFLVSKV
jgi:hypothetical protein